MLVLLGSLKLQLRLDNNQLLFLHLLFLNAKINLVNIYVSIFFRIWIKLLGIYLDIRYTGYSTAT